MAKEIILLLIFAYATYAEVNLITEPKPGEEYVFLQTSGVGSRPIERKDKATENERIFETAHKLPPSVTYTLNPADEKGKDAKPQKREASPGDAPAPAPAGAIKLDPLKLLEKYKEELKTSTTSTTAKPKRGAARGTATSTTAATTTTTRRTRGGKRTKKEAGIEGVTNPTPVLTTGAAAPKPIEDDVPLLASGSEKQRSRIQIKKGPNGQEYEYEYVYYYYDEEDDKKVSNSHDGPARNEVTQKPSRGRGTTSAPEPAVNEVLPTSRSRSRGRQLPEEEPVGEERLPANTRFPPRSRNLNTTPLPGEEERNARGRGRGRTGETTSSETDSQSDETQGSRGRTRANVRRPSLELVDSASFNTHSSGNEPPSRPSFPADLPAGPVRFLGATPNERMEIPAEAPLKSEDTESKVNTESEVTNEEEATTMMSPMDKVALDLYAILQGTQKLAGEEDTNTELDTTDPNDMETTTEIPTTEIPTTEIITPSTTTTTTTTTTTPAPTTSSAPEGGRRRFHGRGGAARKTTPHTSTTESSQDKPKSKFERPRFGSRPRPGARTTSAPAEEEVQKEEVKTNHARPTNSRSRFGGSRTRVTTAATSEGSPSDDNTASSSAPARPSLRPRPTFNLRSRTRTTAAPTEEEQPQGEETDASSTTARPRSRITGSPNVRPLRPGPRINLAGGRGRLGVSSTTEASTDSSPSTNEETSPKTEDTDVKEPETSPVPDTNPLNRLRNRQRPTLQVRPKTAASAPVQVRRVNPLLSRRKPGAVEPTSSEAPQEAPPTEAIQEADEVPTDIPAAPSSTTTEEPRGLNRLLAGRRRLANRQPGTVA